MVRKARPKSSRPATPDSPTTGGSFPIANFTASLDDVASYVIECRGPHILSYADTLQQRVVIRSAKASSAPPNVYSAVWRNSLFFLLAKEARPGVESEAGLRAIESAFRDDGISSQPLWLVVDSIIQREAHARKQADGELHITRVMGDVPEEDSALWYQFWALYRDKFLAGSRPTTTDGQSSSGLPSAQPGSNQTASARSLLPTLSSRPATTAMGSRFQVQRVSALFKQRQCMGKRSGLVLECSLMRRQLTEPPEDIIMEPDANHGLSSVGKQIMRELGQFEELDRHANAEDATADSPTEFSPMSTLQGTRGLAGAVAGGNSWDCDPEIIPEDICDDMNEVDDTTCKLLPPLTSDRPHGGAGWRPTADDANNDHHRNAITNVHSIGLDAPTSQWKHGVFRFKGFDDYKQRLEAAHAKPARCIKGRTIPTGVNEVMKAITTEPQWQWPLAVHEHHSAREWRSKAEPAREAQEPLTPQTARGSSRARPAEFHRPWSREGVSRGGPRPCGPRGNTRGTEAARGGFSAGGLGDAGGLGGFGLESSMCATLSGGEEMAPSVVEDAPEMLMDASASENADAFTPIHRFAKVCLATGIHPQPATVKFLIRLPPMLNLAGMGYSDEDVLALAASLPMRPNVLRVEALNLGENPRLSDAAVCKVLNCFSERFPKCLQLIRLSSCHRLGRDTILLCTGLLRQKLERLQVLDLSSIKIGVQEYLELASAIQAHMRLRKVLLSETGLGNFDRSFTSQIISQIVANPRLECLQLGWNLLDTNAFETLGRGVVDMPSLKTLGLANTAPCPDPTLNGSALLILLEHLARDRSVTALDISNNALNADAMLVLEAAGLRHPTLRQVNISKNPLGVDGMRPVLRLLAWPACAELTQVIADECSSGTGGGNVPGPFDVEPSGQYVLDLAQPARRAMLRLLLMRFAEGGGGGSGSIGSYVRGAVINRRGVEANFNMDSIKRGNSGVWEVPTQGTLSFLLSVGEAVLGPEAEISSCFASEAIARILERSRAPLKGERKTLALLSLIKGAVGKQQEELLEALACDFQLTPEHVRALCFQAPGFASSWKDTATFARRLMPCLIRAEHVRACIGCTGNLGELYRVEAACQGFLSLNLENPTGRYTLNLSEPSERCCAERLLVLNRWQMHLWKAAGRTDITQHKNGKNLRNETFNSKEIVRGADEWRLPQGIGVMKFDFVSLSRPPTDAQPMSKEAWEEILTLVRSVLYQRECSSQKKRAHGGTTVRPKLNVFMCNPDSVAGTETEDPPAMDLTQPLFSLKHPGGVKSTAVARCRRSTLAPTRKLKACLSEKDLFATLAMASSMMWLTCMQLRELLCTFHHASVRADAMVCFFGRCVDWPVNGKVCCPKFKPEDWQGLRKRLGYINLFSYFQPEGMQMMLDLSVHEQRRALHMAIKMAICEHPTNVKNPRMDWSNTGKWESFVAGVPPTWDSLDNIPTKGIFQGTYMCSRECVRLKFRRRQAITIGGWSVTDDVNAISAVLQWWSILDEVPETVVRVMVFILTYFKLSFMDCFTYCDGNKDGKLNNNEFVKRLQAIGCLGKRPRLKGRGALVRTVGDEDDASSVSPRRASGGAGQSNGASPVPRGLKNLNALAGAQGSATTSMSSAQEEEVERHQVAALTNVFRFLDTTIDGDISMKEFTLLESVWRELWQSTWEFKTYLENIFGSLEQAWLYAMEDKDGGMLPYSEFEQFTADIQFHGPSRQIFLFLDQDANESIVHAEWFRLAEVGGDAFPRPS